MTDPYEIAARHGITVIHRQLRTTHGRWLPEHDTIVLHNNLRRVHDRATLAHELGHALLGHHESTPKHERAADRYAAHLLIDRERLHDHARRCPDLYTLAHELDVPPSLVTAYLKSA